LKGGESIHIGQAAAGGLECGAEKYFFLPLISPCHFWLVSHLYGETKILAMHFDPNHVYHVYNRGNNKTRIFFNNRNYLFLLRKIRKEWLSFCEIFSYCLMPNHFHFMLLANARGCENLPVGNLPSHMQKLSKSIGKTLSSYTRATNKQNNTTGNLFQQGTKSKCLTDIQIEIEPFHRTDYLVNCFHYIHLNPLKAGLVSDLRDWPYSSWPDYAGFRNGNLCSMDKAIRLLGLSGYDFRLQGGYELNPKVLERIW
jgi:putative transposase